MIKVMVLVFIWEVGHGVSDVVGHSMTYWVGLDAGLGIGLGVGHEVGHGAGHGFGRGVGHGVSQLQSSL